jgi:uncharacterized membrane protein YhhN
MISRIFLALFVVVSIGELTSEVTDITLLHQVMKPLIMISLIGYYTTSVTARSGIVIGAMICSLAGDVLLMNPDYFIPGLVAFLLSHILYIFAYRQHQWEESGNVLTGVHRTRLAFPILLAGTGLVVILYPSLGDLKIPVIVYATVITVMAMTALFRYGKTNQKSFWLIFAGAILFMMSDSILAVNKFLSPIENGGLWIMLTYITAQYLIVSGLIAHKDQ